LSNETKHIQVSNKDKAVAHNSGYLSTFGCCHDFVIVDKCNENTVSYSNITHPSYKTYDLGVAGIADNTD